MLISGACVARAWGFGMHSARTFAPSFPGTQQRRSSFDALQLVVLKMLEVPVLAAPQQLVWTGPLRPLSPVVPAPGRSLGCRLYACTATPGWQPSDRTHARACIVHGQQGFRINSRSFLMPVQADAFVAGRCGPRPLPTLWTAMRASWTPQARCRSPAWSAVLRVQTAARGDCAPR